MVAATNWDSKVVVGDARIVSGLHRRNIGRQISSCEAELEAHVSQGRRHAEVLPSDDIHLYSHPTNFSLGLSPARGAKAYQRVHADSVDLA
jgi:hypothetical protein